MESRPDPRKDRAFSRSEFARREQLEVLGRRLPIATLEDTIVAKLEWASLGGMSERQLEDVRELVALAGAQLDRDYLELWTERLGLLELWRSVDS